MQLHFTSTEFQSLANLLLEASCTRQTEVNATADVQAKSSLKRRLQVTEDLVAKILAKELQLDFDELDELMEILRAKKRDLGADIERTEDSDSRRDLEGKRVLVEALLERVSETSAMF